MSIAKVCVGSLGVNESKGIRGKTGFTKKGSPIGKIKKIEEGWVQFEEVYYEKMQSELWESQKVYLMEGDGVLKQSKY
jgi:hypothetical protein